MQYAQVEEKIRASKHLLDGADSENIIERCKQYLALLDKYRALLYELRKPASPDSTPGKFNDRNVLRAAIETTTSERNRVQRLLLSFTTVSAYEAVDVFNGRNYQGHDNWELRASGIKFPGGGVSDLMTIQDAVDLASLLRRQDHIATV